MLQGIERLIGSICEATGWERKHRRFAQLRHLMFVKKYITKKQIFIFRFLWNFFNKILTLLMFSGILVINKWLLLLVFCII